MAEVQTKPAGQANAVTPGPTSTNGTATEVETPKQGRGGRRVPDGTKITFYVKDAETLTKLKAAAKQEHREVDNMASFIVHKFLHTNEPKAS